MVSIFDKKKLPSDLYKHFLFVIFCGIERKDWQYDNDTLAK